MSQAKTYLVTGAGRGIGKGLAGAILQQPNATLIAAVRDPAKASPTLEALPKASGAKLIVVKLDSLDDTDAAGAVKQLQEKYGITALDVVIANAGIAHSGLPVAQMDPDSLREHFNVNTLAPVLLFQAVAPLLKASSTGNPIFLPMSTSVSSAGNLADIVKIFPPVFSSYGASKAALNWLIARLHFEETWLTTFVMHPGLVLTDMGSGLVAATGDAKSLGAIDVPTSVAAILKMVGEATREGYGGSFKNYDGTSLPW